MPIHEDEAVVCESRSFTQGTFFKLRHIWCIKHFSFYQDEERLESATFCNTEHDAIKWRISLHPQGWNEGVKEFISTFIQLDSSTKGKVRASIRYSILDAKEKLLTARELSKPHEFQPGEYWGFWRFIKRDQVLDHLKKTSTDEIFMCFEVRALVNTVVSPSRILLPKTEEFGTRTSEDSKETIRDRLPPDISLIVNDEKFNDNETVLVAGRPYKFTEMHAQWVADTGNLAISSACADLCLGALRKPAEKTIDTECTAATKSLVNISEENSDSSESLIKPSETSTQQMTPSEAAEVLESNAQAKSSNDSSDDDGDSVSSSFSIISE